MTDNELHAIAWKTRQLSWIDPLSEGQEWLWEAIVSELEYRRRSCRPVWKRCSCELCVGPFDAP